MSSLIKGGIQNEDPAMTKSRVFSLLPGFKEWIEQTQLFATIRKFAGSGIIIEGLPDSMRLHLTGISKIEKAEDLPIELIQQFFINSPFINHTNNDTTKENPRVEWRT